MSVGEWVALSVNSCVAIFVALIGASLARSARRAESRQLASRRIVDRLIELHAEMAPKLNDVMCFFVAIGHFREIDPPDVVRRKRSLDRTFFANEHLFGPDTGAAYRDFVEVCFAHWGEPGADARLRTSPARQRIERGDALPWDPDWDDLFVTTPGEDEPQHEQRAAYDRLMHAFARELGVEDHRVARVPAPREPAEQVVRWPARRRTRSPRDSGRPSAVPLEHLIG